MKKNFSFLINLFSFFILIFLISCSSAPKRPMLETEIVTISYSKLEKANDFIVKEDYVHAIYQLSEAYNLALSVDNATLLCKISLSGIVLNIACPEIQNDLFSVEMKATPAENSFLFEKNEKILENAKKFASRADREYKKGENFFSNICVIYEARIKQRENF